MIAFLLWGYGYCDRAVNGLFAALPFILQT